MQACHSCLEIGQKNYHSTMPHPRLVVIGIKNENKLALVAGELEEKGLIVRRFYEEDGQLTSFATQPIVEEQRIHVKRFMLL